MSEQPAMDILTYSCPRFIRREKVACTSALTSASLELSSLQCCVPEIAQAVPHAMD